MARGAKLPIGLQFHLNPSSFFLLNTTHLLFPIIFISWQEMYWREQLARFQCKTEKF